jgi:hypothetical protein
MSRVRGKGATSRLWVPAGPATARPLYDDRVPVLDWAMAELLLERRR